MPPRYSTPPEGTLNWHTPLNENFDRLETDVEHRGLDADRSSIDPLADKKYLSTDTGAVYIGDGKQWNRLGVIGNGSTTTESEGAGTIVTSLAELGRAIQNSPDTWTWSEHTQAGDMFVLPSGEYNPTSDDLPIIIDRPVWIRGCGRRQTVINLPAGYDGVVFDIDYADYGHIAFSDFAVVGDGGLSKEEDATNGQLAFRLREYTHNWRFHRILCHGVGMGIHAEGDQSDGWPGAWLGTIGECSFRRCNRGVDLDDNSHAVRVTNCSFDGNRDSHLRVRQSSGVAIHGCQFEEWADYGVRLDCVLGATIHGCYFEDSTIAQIGLQPDTSRDRVDSSHRVTASIRGCRFKCDFGDIGIQAGYVSKCTAENNTFGEGGQNEATAFQWTTDFAESEMRWDWNRINTTHDVQNGF